MAARQPPRFVPTLTEVVAPSVAGAAGSARAGAMLAEEQLVHRIMQRIDLTLERRLREAAWASATDGLNIRSRSAPLNFSAGCPATASPSIIPTLGTSPSAAMRLAMNRL